LLIESAGESFDWIVIDSPPVLPVTDAALVAYIAGAVLFVVAAEQTKRPTALAALEQLDSARARFIGAVLNRVDLDRNAFFHSHYYRRGFSSYYGQSA
jgi:Mrp family chromosome partitioning ATPase